MASSSQPTLEERVAVLEKAVAELLRAAPGESATPRFKDWRGAIGMFPGNELQQEIDAAGAQIRNADRQDAGA